MRKSSLISSIFISLVMIFGCENPAEEIQSEIQDVLSGSSKSEQASKITGSVQVEWKGKGGSGLVYEKLVLVSFDAHESVGSKPAKGSFVFSVWKSENEPEREIVAQVLNVGFGDSDEKKGWFFAEVISDSKCDSDGQTGGSDTEHTEGDGCSDSGHTTSDEGGTTHDEGCSHDTGTDEVTDEGCSDSGGSDMGSGEDSGTVHDDTGTEHDEGMGGKPDDKGGKGKQCRVGQYLVVKMHDKGSPGINDGITWKWFDNLDGFSIEAEPQKLCKKTILGGNLTVHIAKEKKTK